MSPAKALLGYELRKRGDWATPAYVKERQAQRRTRAARLEEIRGNQDEYNRRKYPGGDPERIYVEGDLVMVKDDRQTRQEFSPKWLGPCHVTRRLSSEVYEVEREGDVVKIHVDKLRSAPRGNPELQEVPEDPSSDEDSSSDSSLSEVELSDEEESQESQEERRDRDPEAAAVRPEREAEEAPREGPTRKMTDQDDVSPQPSTSRNPRFYTEEGLEDTEETTMWRSPSPASLPPKPPKMTKTKPTTKPPLVKSRQHGHEKTDKTEAHRTKKESDRVKEEEQTPETTTRDASEKTHSEVGNGSYEPQTSSRPPGRKRRRRLVILDAPGVDRNQT